MELVCLQGLTYEEAAAALSISVGTVKSRMHSARDQLQESWRNMQRRDVQWGGGDA